MIDLSKEPLPNLQPEDVQRIREGLGLSQGGLAKLLRMGNGAGRTVRSWELGEVSAIPGPVQMALRALDAGWRPGMTTFGPADTAKRLERIRARAEELAYIAEELAKDA